MLLLKYRHNSKTVFLNEVPNGYIPVILKSGDTEYRKWLGFIDVRIARQIEGAKPVKLCIWEYSYGPEPGRQWETVPSNMALQGCLTNAGAYAITDVGVFRVIRRPSERRGP